MRVGILFNRIRVEEKLILAELERRGVEHELIDVREVVFELDKPGWKQYDVVLERCISHSRALTALRILGAWGVPCVNPFHVGEICGDKLNTSLALVAAGVPTPRVEIALTPESALEAIERMGYQTFADTASAAGIDGVLTVDLPPEEAVEFNAQLKAAGLETIFLLAPTSTDERLRRVAEMAGGFIYYVSLKGVTGAGHIDVDAVRGRVENLRRYSTLPVMVGFGIKDASSAQAVARCADGVVVGSALVELMGRGESHPVLLAALKDKVLSIRRALDELSA